MTKKTKNKTKPQNVKQKQYHNKLTNSIKTLKKVHIKKIYLKKQEPLLKERMRREREIETVF